MIVVVDEREVNCKAVGQHTTAVQENRAALVKDTVIRRTSVQVDAAVLAMLCVGESQEVSSLFASLSPTPADHDGLPRRGPP